MGKSGTKQEITSTNWKEPKRTRQALKERDRTRKNDRTTGKRISQETKGQDEKEQKKIRKNGKDPDKTRTNAIKR